MRRAVTLLVGLGVVASPRAAGAQTFYEQTYLPASHNWEFRGRYPGADRLFNAFDYGHAILYEILYARPKASPAVLETKEFDFITRRLLVDPPDVPLEESAIGPTYVKLVPEVKAMFEWAHILHRQIYDVWADERISDAEKDARIAQLLRYYKSRPDLAFSSAPKSMELMEGQFYSRTFRERYPKFNGLIWAYHWLQVALYDALMEGTSAADRRAKVAATVEHFRCQLAQAPSGMPRVMPMTAAVAPRFAARYPEAAIIFDNLHAMHDVVSDILVSDSVPRRRKRAEILKAAAMYRDAESFVTSRDEWLRMSVTMGVGAMGGEALAGERGCGMGDAGRMP